MALPQKHTVTVNAQVRGGVNRIVALQSAVAFHCDFGGSKNDVTATAETFLAWLEQDGEDHAADAQRPGGGE